MPNSIQNAEVSDTTTVDSSSEAGKLIITVIEKLFVPVDNLSSKFFFWGCGYYPFIVFT